MLNNELLDLFVSRDSKQEEVKLTPPNYYKRYCDYYYELNLTQMAIENNALANIKKLKQNMEYVYDNEINRDSRYGTLIYDYITTMKHIIKMYKKSDDISKVRNANTSMRCILEQTFKYCNNLPVDYPGHIHRIFYDRMKKYHPGPHANYNKYEFSIPMMLDNILFGITELNKVTKYSRIY
ncbi:hypothetical protein [Paraclostridium bifermentans]|uniref:hypothetical protein n=1 Tax=Paraclostridium bifermentans TaxID=1490 RepID=UPI00374E252C